MGEARVFKARDGTGKYMTTTLGIGGSLITIPLCLLEGMISPILSLPKIVLLLLTIEAFDLEKGEEFS